MTLIRTAVTGAPLDLAGEWAALAESGADSGAVVTFTGLCRDEGGRLTALELEHYPGMAEAELARIAQEASERWPLQAMTVLHRHGLVKPGEAIVLVAAASTHRQAAFAAAEFVMDFLKTDAPFWKKEHLVDGSTSGWVEARASDDLAKARWQDDRAPAVDP